MYVIEYSGKTNEYRVKKFKDMLLDNYVKALDRLESHFYLIGFSDNETIALQLIERFKKLQR